MRQFEAFSFAIYSPLKLYLKDANFDLNPKTTAARILTNFLLKI